MSTIKVVAFLGKIALLATVVSVYLTLTISASPITPGFDLSISNDVLGNSLGTVSCSPIAGGKHGRCDGWQ